VGLVGVFLGGRGVERGSASLACFGWGRGGGGSLREIYYRAGSLREIHYRAGSLREIYYRAGSLREIHYRAGSLREIHYRAGSLREIHYRGGSLREIYYRAGSLREIHYLCVFAPLRLCVVFFPKQPYAVGGTAAGSLRLAKMPAVGVLD
jgi:hypothetical protein